MRFAILGSLAVTHDGRSVEGLSGALTRRLLAILLVHARHPVPGEQLVDWLWGDELDGWKQRLHPLVSRLRKALSEADGRDRIFLEGASYYLDFDRDEVDALVFEDLQREAAEALGRGDLDGAVASSDRALAEWRGVALGEFARDRFAHEWARKLDAHRLTARQVRIEALLALGGHDDEIVPEAEALVAIDPDNERLLATLMLALHRRGRTGTARAAFRDYRDDLAKRTGDEPSDELASLERAMAAGDPALDWTPPPGRQTGEGAAPRTFLFTALDDSSSLETGPDAAAIDAYGDVVGAAIANHNGRAFGEDGTRISALFERPLDAVLAARDAAVGVRHATAGCRGLRVRLAVHTGEVTAKGLSFVGPAVSRLGRLRDAGHPGQVVVSAATRELVAEHLPADVRMIGIGACQFDDSSHPERVFQLVHDELNTEFPPLRAGQRPLGQLPLYTTGFVGREHEVNAIAGRLERPGLVTITGDGGIGKTRLAVEVATRTMTAQMAEGVCYCDVSLAEDAQTLVERLALARGLALAADGDHRRELVRSFEAAEVLVVLDGCERLREPVSALVTDILASGPDARLLVTSQRRLGATGEQVVKLDPLSVPRPSDPEPESAPAVLLLRQRAVQSGARIAPADPHLIELARRLDGLPLAIELAAPLLASIPPIMLVARLDRCLEAVNGSPDAPRRHRTLRATFDWSFDLVGASAGRLFGALSLFRDPWSLEMAEAVAAAVDVEPDEVVALTAELVDQSIVRVDMPSGGTARYTMLDTIRTYAAEHLRELGRYDDVADLHAVHFLELAERAVPHRRGPDEPAWVGELQAEFDDLRAAYRRLVDTGRPADALRLVIALTHDLLMRERLEIGRWATELALLPALADEPLRVEALGLAANAAMLEGRFPEAVRHAEAALVLEAATGAASSWTAHNVLAMMIAFGATDGRWSEHLHAMEAVGTATGDPFPSALALWDRAFVARWTNEPELSETAAAALVALGNHHDNPSIRSMGLLALGRVAALRCETDRARDLLCQARGAAEAACNTLVLNQTQRELAEVDADSGNRARALAALRPVAQSFAESGNVSEQLQTGLSIVEHLVALGELLPAARALNVLRRVLGDVLDDIPAYVDLEAKVTKLLAPADRDMAHDAGSRMQLGDLVEDLLRVVDSLTGGSGDPPVDGQADGHLG